LPKNEEVRANIEINVIIIIFFMGAL